MSGVFSCSIYEFYELLAIGDGRECLCSLFNLLPTTEATSFSLELSTYGHIKQGASS